MKTIYEILKEEYLPDLNFQVELIDEWFNILDIEWNLIDDIEINKDEVLEKYNKYNTIEKVKKQKKEQIEQIATLSDQLNLMAWILAEQILAKPENERSELEKKWLEVYQNIQNILTN